MVGSQGSNSRHGGESRMLRAHRLYHKHEEESKLEMVYLDSVCHLR